MKNLSKIAEVLSSFIILFVSSNSNYFILVGKNRIKKKFDLIFQIVFEFKKNFRLRKLKIILQY